MKVAHSCCTAVFFKPFPDLSKSCFTIFMLPKLEHKNSPQLQFVTVPEIIDVLIATPMNIFTIDSGNLVALTRMFSSVFGWNDLSLSLHISNDYIINL